jgi:hypothetical protein
LEGTTIMSYIGASPTTAAFLTDTFSANGSGTVFTLSTAPANTNSILVAVSGVLQDPSTYSVSGTTLTFSAAPPAGTGNISVRFLGIPASGVTTTAYRTQTEFTATAGQTTFTPPSYTVGFIDVYRNGVLLGSADFTASNGTTVVLANPATAGDLIETVSFLVSSVLNAIPATAGAVTTPYLLDGSVTQAKLAAGVAGNGPAFSAYPSANQSVSNASWTKITYDVESFDTNNNFASSRFTPTVAGYYQINARALANGYANNQTIISIWKNGSESKRLNQTPNSTASSVCPMGSALIFMNGSTDFLEIYVNQNSGSTQTFLGGFAPEAYFEGFLARTA